MISKYTDYNLIVLINYKFQQLLTVYIQNA